MNTLGINMTGDRLSLHVPITKVDEERRLVSGFATLNNLDKHGHIVDADASEKAFARFRGNIREMHLPKAVGRMIQFGSKAYHSEEDGKEYRGIFVTARVSKGAQDTWEKVLDGTLSGFSIGAIAKDIQKSLDEDGNEVGVIKDYDLFELSLVDSPANPLANVISIQKMDDGTFKVDGIATMIDEPEEEVSEKVENDGARITERFLNIIEKLLSQGGNTMDKKVEKAEETVEEIVEKADEAIEPVAEEQEVEKAADVSEVEDAPDAAPALDVESLIEKALEDRVEAIVSKVLERLAAEAESEEAVEDEVTEVTKSEEPDPAVEELKGLVTKVAENVDSLITRISSLEDGSVEKKSSDVESEEVTQKSFWGNTMVPGFLSVNEL